MNQLIRDTHFIELAETKPDSKNRVTLINVPTKAHHYRIYMNDSGQIVLDPQLSIPAAEVWLFKNKKALSAVMKGLADAEQRNLANTPEDYSKYIE